MASICGRIECFLSWQGLKSQIAKDRLQDIFYPLRGLLRRSTDWVQKGLKPRKPILSCQYGSGYGCSLGSFPLHTSTLLYGGQVIKSPLHTDPASSCLIHGQIIMGVIHWGVDKWSKHGARYWSIHGMAVDRLTDGSIMLILPYNLLFTYVLPLGMWCKD